MSVPFSLHTIGYSTFAPDNFVDLLREYSVGALIDVRNSPYSGHFHEYDRENLQATLKKENIYYLHTGDALGARPGDPALYTEGTADFGKIARNPAFLGALARIRKGLDMFPVCLMCSQNDPLICHRAILITHEFRKLYPEIEIFHLYTLKKTRLIRETQEEFDKRLLAGYESGQYDLFADPGGMSLEQRLDDAYRQQGRKIAFRPGARSAEQAPASGAGIWLGGKIQK